MDKFKLIRLYETYSELLTKKQQDVFKLYYMDDLSLREVAEILKISFQAVRDSIEKSKKQLIKLEEKLKVCKLKDAITTLEDMLKQENITNKEEIFNLINNMK